jgi:hypothetical protein
VLTKDGVPYGEMQFGINDRGAVNFGLWEYDPKKRPGHGGLWSSRGEVFKAVTGIDTVPVVVDGCAAHMIRGMAYMITPEGYKWADEGWYMVKE